MATEALKTMKEQLMSCVQGQLGDISKVDAHELGEAVDMIKDLAEAIYYCTITESMEKADEKEIAPVNNINYYTTPTTMYNGGGRTGYYPEMVYRDAERTGGYMYYPSMTYASNGNGGRGGNSSDSTSYYTEMPYDMMRDPREGRSPMRRRMYMEGKETHNDPKSQMRELEAYLQELSNDITEMIKDASPEERATLHQKMTTLASKIA